MTKFSKAAADYPSNKEKQKAPQEKPSFTEKAKEKMSLSRASTLKSQEFEMDDVSSTTSSVKSWTPPKRMTSDAQPKIKRRTQSHTFSDCGRHSNRWLFNDMSITDAVKTIFEK